MWKGSRPSGWHHQVENLSPFVLSINHNWSNSASFPPLYASHLEAVCSAEEALSDVEELLVQRYARRHDGTGEEEGKGEVGEDEREAGWEHEWVKCVTDLVRADSGWESVAPSCPFGAELKSSAQLGDALVVCPVRRLGLHLRVRLVTSERIEPSSHHRFRHREHQCL